MLLGELDRLQGMVDDLLLLARGDERAFARDEVDVTDVVHEVAARRRPVPGRRRRSTTSRRRRSGDADALRRALDHLVANAARHASTQGAPSPSRCSDGEVARARRRRRAAASRRADRDAVVRRFVRTRRGPGRDHGGAGLGLAVAADVAAAHGGRLEISDSPLGGARVSLILPRAV